MNILETLDYTLCRSHATFSTPRLLERARLASPSRGIFSSAGTARRREQRCKDEIIAKIKSRERTREKRREGETLGREDLREVLDRAANYWENDLVPHHTSSISHSHMT